MMRSTKVFAISEVIKMATPTAQKSTDEQKRLQPAPTLSPSLPPVAGAPVPPAAGKTEAKEVKTRDKAILFTEGAADQMNRIIESCGKLAKLANKGRYTYTEDQVAKIKSALASATADVTAAFEAAKEGKKAGFSF